MPLPRIKESIFKGAFSGLRQFLVTESLLEMMKNAFCFTSKALFVLKIFKFLSRLFGHVAKGLIRKIRQSDHQIWSANRV